MPKPPAGNPSSDQSDESDRSDKSAKPAGQSPIRRRLRPSGGYRDLRGFQTSTIVYDATVAFCERFVDRHSRTVDQMVQSARSGRQNIAEGSRASATSSQTELRLVNVARASLDELLLDYEDFLRQRGFRQWAKDGREALAVRAVGTSEQSGAIAYARWLDNADPAVVANALICLIHQTNYLLDQLIRALERDFISEGGYSEQLAAARIAERREQDRTDRGLRPAYCISSGTVASASSRVERPSFTLINESWCSVFMPPRTAIFFSSAVSSSLLIPVTSSSFVIISSWIPTRPL
jgi:four helix bundle suffix protein